MAVSEEVDEDVVGDDGEEVDGEDGDELANDDVPGKNARIELELML